MTIDLAVFDARLLDREGLWDLGMTGSSIAFVEPAGSRADRTERSGEAARSVDAAGSLVVPPFCDPHFHLDKVFSRDAFGATTPQEAFQHAHEVKSAFTPEDVLARASRALELAAANGIGALRAQCDVDSYTGLSSLEGVLAARERYRGIVDLQVVAFPQEGVIADPATPGLLREAMRLGADLVGGLPEFEADEDTQRRHLREIFDIADEFGAPIDMHIDYVDDPALQTLEMLAELTGERGYQGRVTADHCCALATYPDEQARRVIDKVAGAEIGVTVMPMANLQMLGGPGRTPTTRGSSRLAEMLDRGILVAAGSDNMVDIWYRFNRMDPAELGLVTCLSGGLRTDADVRTGFDMTGPIAARVMGLDERLLEPGRPADMVVLNAPTVEEFLRNVPGRRVLIRSGREVAGLSGQTWFDDGAGAGDSGA